MGCHVRGVASIAQLDIGEGNCLGIFSQSYEGIIVVSNPLIRLAIFEPGFLHFEERWLLSASKNHSFILP